MSLVDARKLRLIGWLPILRGMRWHRMSVAGKPKPCTCKTLHGHCLVVACRCPGHAGEIAG